MRYPDNFKQDLDPAELAGLPAMCTYEGDAPDLAHLRRLLIPTMEVQRVVYVGQREAIWIQMPDGSRERPWLNAYITEHDEHGNVVVRNLSERSTVAKRSPRAMSTGDLANLGLTDARLDRLSRDVLDKPWEPDSLGDSNLRRERFDEVFGVLMGW